MKVLKLSELKVARTHLQNVAKAVENDIYNKLSSLTSMNINANIKHYNDAVKEWNTKMDTFPLNYILK